MLLEIVLLLALAHSAGATSLRLLDSQRFPIPLVRHPPFSFARSANDSILLTDSEGISLYSDLENNFTAVRVGEAGRKEVLPVGEGFITLCESAGGLTVKLLSPIGDVISRKSVPAVSLHSFSLSLLPGARLAILWDSLSSDNDGWGVSACLLTASLDEIKCSFRVNAFTQGDQRSPCVGRLENGFLAAWGSSGVEVGVRMQRFDLAGNRVGAEETASNSSGFQGCYFVPGDKLTMVTVRTSPTSMLTDLYTQAFSIFGLPLTAPAKLPWAPAALLSLSPSPALLLPDESLLVAVNVRTLRDDLRQVYLTRVGDTGCVYWVQRLSPPILQESVAVAITPISANSAEVAYLNLTARELMLIQYEWQSEGECRKPEPLSPFPVAWQRVPIPKPPFQWKLIAITVPLLGIGLLLALAAVMAKACLIHRHRKQMMMQGHATMGKGGKSMDSSVPLRFTEKSSRNNCDDSVTRELGDIVIDFQGTEASPVKIPTLGHITTD